MVIRPEQLAILARAANDIFVDRLLIHVRKCFPKHCESQQDTTLRELIRYGLGRASHYQITTERDLCKFIDLMVVLGRDFDRDSKHAWASSILSDPGLGDPTAKVDALYKEGKKRWTIPMTRTLAAH